MAPVVYLGVPFVREKLYWARAAKATGGYPYQVGLTVSTVIQCTVSCDGGCCMGGKLCVVKDPGTCMNYSEVTGAPAGGSGNNALILNTVLAQAGVAGQMIAGGISNVMMDGGVVAGAGGCAGAGCAMMNSTESRFAFIDAIKDLYSYYIAGGKE